LYLLDIFPIFQFIELYYKKFVCIQILFLLTQIILLGVIIGVSCQGLHYQSPSQAAILSDARYLAGDGTFGAAYTQEDGVEFKEESDIEGNRRGSYSYIDPTGQRRTVTYTAGKNGFQVCRMHI